MACQCGHDYLMHGAGDHNEYKGCVKTGCECPEYRHACPVCGANDITSHNGSKYCESGSIASGGTVAHCTCDTCY